MCLIYEHLMYKHQNPASQLWKLVSSSSTSFTHSVSLLHTTLALSFLFISSPYNFFSLNRYLSCVPSTILNPRESRMKSIKSLSSRIIHSRDCSDSFHALNVLNIFLCVWNMCVWRVVCLGGGVSGVSLGGGMREVVFLQQVNLLECQGASPRPPVPQQCWGKGKASGIPWRQWKYLHPRLT